MPKLMLKRILQYIIGLLLMALAVVLTKRSSLGLAPFSAAPSALNTITDISLGTTTTILHFVCVCVILLTQKKITIKAVLTFFVAFPFGKIIDLIMYFIPAIDGFGFRLIITLVGICCTGVGVALINGADLMLPAPDAMLRVISIVYNKKYPTVKIIGDSCWIIFSISIELIFAHKLVSIGLGTVLAAFLVGRIIKLLNSAFPQITLVKEAVL